MIRHILIAIAACAMFAQSSALMINRPRRSSETCGLGKSKIALIVGGHSFPRGSFPWIVPLMRNGVRPPSFFCGGTLISQTFVISAAHCILEKYSTKELLPLDILAMFGAHDLSDYLEAGRVVHSPKNIFIHDDWNHLRDSFDADIALLEFDEGSIRYSAFIKPICLWDSEIEPPVTEGIVTGWGKSEDPSKIHENQPKMITATIQSQEQCVLETKSTDDFSNRSFCAGLKNNTGVCSGDSGGGFFIKVNGIYNLLGVVSYSLSKDGGCDVSMSAVYTNIPKFRDWIAEKTGSALVSSTQAVKDVFCTGLKQSKKRGKPRTCTVNQTIDSAQYVLSSDIDNTVEHFIINDNKEAKFLPSQIGEKFPMLKKLQATSCGLTVVRNHYFVKMLNLEYLNLERNKISTIDSNSFIDLISVKKLNLAHNKIEKLNELFFATMVKLEDLNLTSNRLRSMNPTAFEIPSLGFVELEGNVCISSIYFKSLIHLLVNDIREHCIQ